MKEKTSAPEKVQKDSKELHDIFFTIAIITAIAAFIFIWLGQNAVNSKGGFVTLQPFNIKKPIEIEFMTTSVCAIIAGVLSAASVGFGVARNALKKEKKVSSYLCGVAFLVLSVITFMAGYYAG